MTNTMVRTVIRTAAGILCMSGTWAMAQVPQLPQGSVDAYRVDSQYGSSTAVMNPIFPHESKLELGVGGAYSPVSSLMSYYAAAGSAVWHINMHHAIEPIWFAQTWGKQDSFVKEEITAKRGSSSTLGVEIPYQVFAASYQYSPYYAKMHITQQSVAHFDVYFGLGAGLVRSRTSFMDLTTGPVVSHPAASISSGIRFLFQNRWGLRLELRDLIHQTENFGSKTTGNTLQIAASADIFFGSFKSSSEN